MSDLALSMSFLNSQSQYKETASTPKTQKTMLLAAMLFATVGIFATFLYKEPQLDQTISEGQFQQVSLAVAPIQAPLLSATSVTTTLIQLSWTALTTTPVDQTGGSAITAYGLEQLKTDNTWLSLSSSTATTFTQTIVSQPGQQFSFRVRAQNAQGWGPYSQILTVTIITPPAQVSKPTLKGQCQSFSITWTTPSNNGAPITSYSVYIAGADGKYYQESISCVGTSLTSSNSCTVPLSTLKAAPFNLVSTSSINVKVAATNEVINSLVTTNQKGYGLQSDLATISSPNPSVPGAVVNLIKCLNQNLGSICISWTAPTISDDGCQVTDYVIEWDQGSGWWTSLTTIDASKTQYNHYHSKFNTWGGNYKYRVTARNVIGSGSTSEVNVLYATIPKPVPNAWIASKDQNTIRFYWTPVIDQDTGGTPITEYRLMIQNPNNFNWVDILYSCNLYDGLNNYFCNFPTQQLYGNPFYFQNGWQVNYQIVPMNAIGSAINNKWFSFILAF